MRISDSHMHTTKIQFITRSILLVVCSILLSIHPATTVFGFGLDEDFLSANDIPFYNPETECEQPSSGSLGNGVVGGYKNPVINHTAPDPSIIYGDDGKFHLYTTGFQHFTSDNMVDWSKQKSGGDWINIKNNPGWSKERWAPDISKVGDIYVLSFSGGSGGTRKIGYSTSSSANGPFTYRGELLHPNDKGIHGSGYDIDPNIVQFNGKIYLYYGSGRGTISAAELTLKGEKLTAKRSSIVFTTKLGESPVKAEGPFVHKRGDYYYLYFSSGDWTNRSGTGNAYRQRVARSTSLSGPFKEKGQPIIESNSKFKSPGHGSVITDNTGTDWKVYMAYPSGSDQRTVVIDKITYKDGWPVINNGNGPSSTKQPGSEPAGTEQPGGDTSPSKLVGSDNKEKVWNYFISRGLTPVAAAGAMGNMEQESSAFDPWAGESGNKTINKNIKGVGFGIIQWTNTEANSKDGRRYRVMKHLEDNGVKLDATNDSQNDKALLLELNWLWSGEYGKKTWQKQVNAESSVKGDPSKDYREDNTGNGSTMVFHKLVERSGDDAAMKQERIDSAEKFLAKYSTMSPGGDCSNSTNGGGTNGGGTTDIISMAKKVKSGAKGLQYMSGLKGGIKGIDCGDCVAFVTTVYVAAGYPKPLNGTYDDEGSGIRDVPGGSGGRDYYTYDNKNYEFINNSQKQPGDILMWSGHVAIYAGGNKAYEGGNGSGSNSSNSCNIGGASWFNVSTAKVLRYKGKVIENE